MNDNLSDLVDALEQLDEALRIKRRLAVGSNKMIRTQKTSTADKMQARKYRRSHKSLLKKNMMKRQRTSQFKRRQKQLSRIHGESEELGLRERMAVLLGE